MGATRVLLLFRNSSMEWAGAVSRKRNSLPVGWEGILQKMLCFHLCLPGRLWKDLPSFGCFCQEVGLGGWHTLEKAWWVSFTVGLLCCAGKQGA